MPEDITDELRKVLRKEAIDNRVTCPKAREIAKELGVPVSTVGAALDQLEIKITGCELGCF